jgi:hypothetical protein
MALLLLLPLLSDGMLLLLGAATGVLSAWTLASMAMLDAASSAVADRTSAWLAVAVSTATLRSCEYSRVTLNSRAAGVQVTLLCLLHRIRAHEVRKEERVDDSIADCPARCLVKVQRCCWGFNDQGFLQFSSQQQQRNKYSYILLFDKHAPSVRLSSHPRAHKARTCSWRVYLRFTHVQPRVAQCV